MIWLENDQTKVAIKTFGAELSHFIDKASDREYMWQGNPDYWKGQAPILFPIVGKVENNKYTYDGKEYEMTNHGLARHSQFIVAEQSETAVTLVLTANEDTLRIYPFQFELAITFTLTGQSVAVEHTVRNAGEKQMFFTIGGHPAFNCPLEKGLDFTDYEVAFVQEEEVDEIAIADSGYIADYSDRKTVEVIPLTADTFKRDALIYKGYEKAEMQVRSSKSEHGVSVAFAGFPYVGVWSMPNCAPYVCIEPWMGHSHVEGFTGNFEEKVGMIALQNGEKWQGTYTITIF